MESIEIDGPFAAGARAVTNIKSSGRLEWQIAQAQFEKAVIEFPLPGTVGRFEGKFEQAASGTKITQYCALEAGARERIRERLWPTLQAGIPEGMRKFGDAMERASRAP